MTNGNNAGHSCVSHDVKEKVHKIWEELNAWRTDPKRKRPVAMTLDASLLAGICMLVAELWDIARYSSNMREAWVDHPDAEKLDYALHKVDPRLVPPPPGDVAPPAGQA